jgi:hypothetical protein
MMSGGRGRGQKVLSRPLAESFAVGRRQKEEEEEDEEEEEEDEEKEEEEGTEE